MPYVPDKIVNKPAQATKGAAIFIGACATLAGCGHFSNGDGGEGFIAALIAVVAFYAAAKIKTTYSFKGGAGVYR